MKRQTATGREAASQNSSRAGCSVVRSMVKRRKRLEERMQSQVGNQSRLVFDGTRADG